MAHASIEEFVCRYFSLPQTALVDNLLYEDKHMDIYNRLYNLHLHTLELSTGSFQGTHQQLMAKKATIIKQLQNGKNKALQQDIDLIETDRGVERVIYEWYPVPYWIASHMIDNNEVILSWKDCYWWGRSAVPYPLALDVAIAKLFECVTFASQQPIFLRHHEGKIG